VNYRHSFHAGNSADVFKHIVLSCVLQSLHKKDSAFCVVDTHAGSGLYPLKKTGEFQQGIGLLWPERESWPALTRYWAIVEKFNPQGKLVCYPGSPLIIREFLRTQDRAVMVELHDEEYLTLKATVSTARNIAVHQGNAWQLLKAFVPPAENRGLVLIDPPYEQPDEFKVLRQSLVHCLTHWRNGIYMAWYPVKERRPIDKFHQALRDLSLSVHAVEFMTLAADVERRLNGSGLILINSPWRLIETLQDTLPALARRLAQESGKPEVRFIDLGGAKQRLLNR
jgi:23S rRNA (adenine2030-N6)-methyltransferase